MILRALRIATAVAILLPLHLLAQSPVPVLKAGVREITLNGRVHTQFNTTTLDGEPDAEWRLRRVRLEARVVVNDVIGGKIQPDFSGDRFSLKDAFVTIRPTEGVELLAGNAHRPFSSLTQYSSLRMGPIEKGLAIRGLDAWDEQALMSDLEYSNRDVGVQLFLAPAWAPAGAELALALLDGPLGGAIVDGFTHQTVARLEAQPRESLRVAAAWSRRHFAPEAGAGAPSLLVAGHALLASVGWDPPAGAYLLGEATAGDFDAARDERFTAAHVWAGYRLPREGDVVSMLEPIARVSHASVTDPAAQDGTLFTAGLNVYFGPLNRVMLDYEVWRPSDSGPPDVGSLKVMFQLGF